MRGKRVTWKEEIGATMFVASLVGLLCLAIVFTLSLIGVVEISTAWVSYAGLLLSQFWILGVILMGS